MTDKHDAFADLPFLESWNCPRCSQHNEEDTLKCVYCGLDYDDRRYQFEDDRRFE